MKTIVRFGTLRICFQQNTSRFMLMELQGPSIDLQLDSDSFNIFRFYSYIPVWGDDPSLVWDESCWYPAQVYMLL